MILTLLACAASTDTASPAAPITWPLTLGGDRPAEVFGPEGWAGEDTLPVVLLLHGFGANGEVQDALLGFSERIEADRFVLIRPDGTPNSDGARFWNATDACCDFEGQGVDDVAYLSGLVEELAATVPIDDTRVYATGHSNGGFMSYRLACDRGDLFAAIAPLAGAMPLDTTSCPAEEQVSVLHIHGDDDPDVPYEGSEEIPSADASLAFWADRGGCDGSGDQGALDLTGDAGAETNRVAWSGCDGAVGAELWTMQGVGHVPLVNDLYPEEVMAWLYAHPRP